MKENITFEQALDRLDAITRELQEGNTSLETSLELYTESAKLLDFCNTTLKSAKLHVQEIFELPEDEVEDDSI